MSQKIKKPETTFSVKRFLQRYSRSYRFILFVLFLFPVSLNLYAKSSYTSLGEDAYSRASYDKALEYFELAIENGDTSGLPYFYSGAIHDMRKNYARSAVYYEQAVNRSLNSKYRKVALWKLVVYYDSIHNYEAALPHVDSLEKMGVRHKTLEQVRERAEIAMTPEKKEARELIAQAKEEEKMMAGREDYLQIAKLYRKAGTLDPDLKGAKERAALFFERAEVSDTAEEIYLELWESEEHPRHAYKLGMLERKKGNYSLSLDYLGKALEKSEEKKLEYYIRVNAAQSHFALRNYESAYSHAVAAEKISAKEDFSSRTASWVACLSSTAKQAKSDCPKPETDEKLFLLSLRLFTEKDLLKWEQVLVSFTSTAEESDQWLYGGLLPAFSNTEREEITQEHLSEISTLYENYSGDDEVQLFLARSEYKTGNYLNATKHCRTPKKFSLSDGALCAKSCGYTQDYARLTTIIRQLAQDYPDQRTPLREMLEKNAAFEQLRTNEITYGAIVKEVNIKEKEEKQ